MNATAIYFFNFDDKSKRVDNSNNNSNSNSSYNNNSNNSINNNSSNNNKNNKYSSDLSTEKRETPHQQQEIETDNFQILYTNPITPNFTNSTPTSISITLPQKVKTQFPNLNSITLNYNTFIKVENLNQNQLNELNNDHLLNFNVYTLDQGIVFISYPILSYQFVCLLTIVNKTTSLACK
ncbi:hypothetical protein CYY_007197 [Polysphondylium violaceum]|uniref:Uncharacterized protein n=1 Tax=Polysphondylium violaceum TaxID=133409 RepID=A0A8J4PR49_9MYCE|nr:hypothetical protein CYY_007197 [Polysphondylium violaceum]